MGLEWVRAAGGRELGAPGASLGGRNGRGGLPRAEAQGLHGSFLSLSGAGRPPWRSYSRCTPNGTCSSMAPTRSAASNWTTGSWQVGAPRPPPPASGSPSQSTLLRSSPRSAKLVPSASRHPCAAPGSSAPTSSPPCQPLPALFSGPPCSGPAQRLKGFSSCTWASLRRPPGTADVRDAALWRRWGKCVGSPDLLLPPDPQAQPLPACFGGPAGPRGQGSPLVPLCRLEAPHWGGVLLSIEPLGLHFEGL